MADTVNDELNRLGRQITEDARKFALPNRKTGALNNSFKFNYSYTTINKFKLNISEMYYGKYLNKKTHYMDRAIQQNLQKGIDSIVEVMLHEIYVPVIFK